MVFRQANGSGEGEGPGFNRSWFAKALSRVNSSTPRMWRCRCRWNFEQMKQVFFLKWVWAVRAAPALLAGNGDTKG